MKTNKNTWRISTKLLATALILSYTGNSQAADEDPLSEELFFGELPVVLSATRLSQPLKDTPASITVIDREMIEASGAIQLVDLLRLVPGFQVAYFTGTKYSATYHGNADQHSRDMQVLINGRSIYDPAFGGVTWNDQELEIDDIERIEVIRGPNAAAYGSNSFAGIINIISSHPSRQQGVHVNLLMEQGGGNSQVSTRYADSVGDLDYRVSLRYSNDKGFEDRYDTAHIRRASFRGDYQFDLNSSLQMEFGFSNNHYQDGFSSDSLQPLRNTPQEHSFQHIRWQHEDGADNEYLIQLYHNHQVVDDYFDTIVLSQNVQGGTGFSSDRYDLEYQHTYRINDKQRVVWGAGARRDKASGIGTFGPDASITRDQVRGFFNMEWNPIDSTVVNLGGMYEKFEDQEGLFSPRVALNYQVDEESTLRIVATRGYRMPTLFESNADLRLYFASTTTPLIQLYYAQGDVLPEEIVSYELGFLKNIPAYNLTLDTRLFNETISSIITSPSESAYTSRFMNSGEYTVNGIDISLDWKPSRNSLIHLGYSLANDYGTYLSSVATTPDTYKVLIDSVPDQSASLLASHRFDNGIQVSGAYYYLSEINWRGDGDSIPSSERLDIKLSKDFKTADMDGDVALIFQNINSDHQDFYTENYWNKSIFLQARLNWQ